jgi:hypothetical protein
VASGIRLYCQMINYPAERASGRRCKRIE